MGGLYFGKCGWGNPEYITTTSGVGIGTVITTQCDPVVPPASGSADAAPPPSVPIREAQQVVVGINGEISFTGSALGGKIPIVFGSDKISGNVIWASDVVQHTVPDGSVEGGTVVYSTVSFAVALCEGPIQGVLRIWDGSRLVHSQGITVDDNGQPVADANGSVASMMVDLTDPASTTSSIIPSLRQTKITVYTGSETQTVDPTMAAEETAQLTPAYRGVAYVVFDNYILANNSVPQLFFEVCASTSAEVPRLYFQAPETPYKLVSTDSTGILFGDPKNSILHVSGNKSFHNWGVFQVDINEFTEYGEADWTDRYGGGDNLSRERQFLLPNGMFVVADDRVTNAGPLGVYEPYSGQIVDTFGPSFNGGTTSTSFSSTQYFAVLPNVPLPAGANPSRGMVVCRSAFIQSDVGFIAIDDGGNFITYDDAGTETNWCDYVTGIQPKAWPMPLYVNGDKSASKPTFADGAASLGYHFYLFEQDTVGSVNGIGIKRVTVATSETASTLDNLSAVDCGTIASFDIWRAPTPFKIALVLQDPSDLGYIVFVVATNNDRLSRAFKYDPFAGDIVWITELPDTFGTEQSGYQQHAVVNQTFIFPTENHMLVKLDLRSGQISVLIQSFSDANLPLPDFDMFWFNGYDNTVVYASGAGGEDRLVKIYAERIARGSILLADVVTSLLSRIGLTAADWEVSGLTDLDLLGYTISQVKTLRSAFADLGQVFTFDIVESDGRIKFVTRGQSSAATIAHKWLKYTSEEGWLEDTAANDFTRARKINVTYVAQDREYAADTQSVLLPDYSALPFENEAPIDVTIPVVVTADKAKKLGEILLYSKIVYQHTYEFELPPRYMYLDPADVITIDRDSTDLTLRIRQVTLGEDGSVKVSATKEQSDIYTDQVALFSASGRFNPTEFTPTSGRVDVVPLMIPWRSRDEQTYIAGRYYVPFVQLNRIPNASLNAVSTVTIDGTSFNLPAPGDDFPTHGTVLVNLNTRGSIFSTDTDSEVRIRLINTGSTALESCTDIDTMIANSNINLAMIGDELVQFQEVTDNGDGTYTLRNFTRGLYNTEAAVNTHRGGERFILLSNKDGVLSTAYRVLYLPLNESAATEVGYPSVNITTFARTQDPRFPNKTYHFDPLNYRPLAVADASMVYDTGDVNITWSRRDRAGYEWIDGEETPPLSEPTEEYTLYLSKDLTATDFSNAATYLRRVVVTSPEYVYDVASQTADGFDNTSDTLYCVVAQSGGHAGNIGTPTVLTLDPE